jgi:hypothetical protein
MDNGHGRILIAVMLAGLVAAAPTFAAKKKNKDQTPEKSQPADTTDAARAELAATLQLANVKVSRISLAEDGTLTSMREVLGGIYDRQEAAIKEGISKLHVDAGDKRKLADAIDALNASDDEVTKYFNDHPDAKDRITKRNKLINAEVGQIVRTPDGYVAMLKNVGVAGGSLDEARSLVKDASKKAGGKAEGDSVNPVLDARSKVRGMLTPDQVKALDAQLGGKQ